MLNGINPLNDEVTIQGDSVDNFMSQNEHITNGNSENNQNPFVTDDKVDLNKVQDLSEFIHDDSETFNTDPVSITETSNNKDELSLTSGDNVVKNDTSVKTNDFSLDEHIKYEQDMNFKNIDDTISTTNATVGSTLQFDDESFKSNDDFKNEFIDNNHFDKSGLYEDRKFNDSVSTTDAILGSEPHTPMRMDNQSTFESENDDDQFSESFKQQLQFNHFDENNDKENHDPFCFEQTEDPAGIIPNVNNETHSDSENVKPEVSSEENQVPELDRHEPIEEPICIKEEAKPFHSVYEQQYLPESDFSASTHEALLNAIENDVSATHLAQNDVIESHDSSREQYVEDQLNDEITAQNHNSIEFDITSHTNNIKKEDCTVDDIKYHAEGLKQELYNDNAYGFQQDSFSVNSVNRQSEHLEPENSDIINNELKHVEGFKQESYAVGNNVEDFDYSRHTNFETINHVGNVDQTHNNVTGGLHDYVEDLKQDLDIPAIQNHTNDFKQEYHDNAFENIPNNIKDFEQGYQNIVTENVNTQSVDLKQEEHFNVTGIQSRLEDNTETAPIHVRDFEHEFGDVNETEQNHVDNSKQDYQNVENIVQNHMDDSQLLHNDESTQNHATDSDEEMHSSMIIHSDVENNMPQPYCSAPNTLIAEPDMMCTSMTFEENFQNRNMSDSLYVMETSSDYFGEEIQKSVEEQSSSTNNETIEPATVDSEVVPETKPEIDESKVEEIKTEITEAVESVSQEKDEKGNDSDKVCLTFLKFNFSFVI